MNNIIASKYLTIIFYFIQRQQLILSAIASLLNNLPQQQDPRFLKEIGDLSFLI
jgi:hypothetical protein